MQLIMAGNDTQGLRYGSIKTPEKYYLEWKEEGADACAQTGFPFEPTLHKQRFLQIVHDFIVFDAGMKKTCCHNQFFGTEAAKQHVARRKAAASGISRVPAKA